MQTLLQADCKSYAAFHWARKVLFTSFPVGNIIPLKSEVVLPSGKVRILRAPRLLTRKYELGNTSFRAQWNAALYYSFCSVCGNYNSNPLATFQYFVNIPMYLVVLVLVEDGRRVYDELTVPHSLSNLFLNVPVKNPYVPVITFCQKYLLTACCMYCRSMVLSHDLLYKLIFFS